MNVLIRGEPIPWKPVYYGPAILNPRRCGGNVITSWDVAFRLETGKWPDSFDTHMATEDGEVTLRIDFHEGRTAARLTHDIPRLVRDLQYARGWSQKKIIAHTGLSRRLIQYILAGRFYWWCGGGSKTWLERFVDDTQDVSVVDAPGVVRPVVHGMGRPAARVGVGGLDDLRVGVPGDGMLFGG
jgi:hypothetical protein